ncbi:Transposon Ty1-DR3 Gag-Pol polyprotein, partial [Hondaea fermentalgiana]
MHGRQSIFSYAAQVVCEGSHPPVAYLVHSISNSGGASSKTKLQLDTNALDERALSAVNKDDESQDPQTINDIKNMPSGKRQEWEQSLQREYSNLIRTRTLEVAKEDDYKNQPIMNCKWVFKTKSDGTKKSRLVCVGTNEPIASPLDVFSPTVDRTSLHIVTILALTRGHPVIQADVTGAFLEAKLKENDRLFMRAPPGLNMKKGTILRLRTSLYGLRSAPKRFNELLTGLLLKLGLKQSKMDPSLFFAKDVLLVVHVDDIRIAAKKERAEAILEALRKRLTITTESGRKLTYLGTSITMDYAAGVAHLSQEAHCLKVLQAHKMDKANPTKTPMDKGQELPDHDKDERHPQYRARLGSLMYLLQSRPDMAFILNQLSRHAHRNGKIHAAAMKRIFRYVQGSKSLHLSLRALKSEEEVPLYVFCDANYLVSDDPHYKGTTGYIIALGTSAICWRSVKQSLVASSSFEAEFQAMSEAYSRAVGIQQLLEEIGIKVGPIIMLTDAQSPMKTLRRGTYTTSSRHVALRYLRLCWAIEMGRLIVRHIPGEKNPADLLTKSLGAVVFDRHRNSILESMLPTQFKTTFEVSIATGGVSRIKDDITTVGRHGPDDVNLSPM